MTERAAIIGRVQIQQLVINLVRNAVEAMERSRLKRLQIGIAANGEGIRVDVADAGRGLSEDVARHLFQPFVTTKSTGMGRGLSICRDIVEARGGRLRAEPNQLNRTVFSFALPPCSKARQV